MVSTYRSSILNNLKVCLPIYLTPFWISGYGSFELGLSLYTIFLPFLILIYLKDVNRTRINYLILFVSYVLATSFLNLNTSIFKLINFVLGSIFLTQYLSSSIINKESFISNLIIGLSLITSASFFYFVIDYFFLNYADSYHIDKIVLGTNIPRISGLFLEPSHFGLSLAALITLKNFNNDRKFIYFFWLLLILSQSYFAFMMAIIPRLKTNIIIIIMSLSLLYIYFNFSVDDLLGNSGLVRLFGIIYLIGNSLISFLGNGVSSGQELFADLGYENYNILEFSGFVADIFVDIGVIGLAFLFIALFKETKNKIYGIIVFFILNLNFGIAVSLFPFLLTSYFITRE